MLFSIVIKSSIDFSETPSFLIGNPKLHYPAKIGDINGDGLLDLIFSGWDEKLEVYLNSESGISSSPSYTSSDFQNAFDLSLGDFDRNGYLDVLVVNFSSPVRVYLNNNGTLKNTPDFILSDARNSISGSVFNLSNDGFEDIVLGGDYEPIRIYENNNGTIPSYATWVSQEEDLSIQSIKTGDLDKDGFEDIIIASYSGPLRLYKSNSGSFSTFNWESKVYLDAQDLELIDVNSDGFKDAVVSQWNNSIVIFKNNNGQFEDYPFYYSYNNGFYSGISASDIDGDGFQEFFISNDSFKVEGYDNIFGSISYTPDFQTEEDSHQWGLAIGDLNGDKRNDFCIAKRYQKSSCFFNLGNFTEENPSPPEISFEVMGQNVTFHLSNASDDNTPFEGLSYFLRIGKTVGGRDVLYSPLGTTDFTPIFGKFSSNLLSFTLPDGIYYASAQAVDLSFLRSSWSNEVSFMIDTTPPNSLFTFPQNGQEISTCGIIDVEGIAEDNVSGIDYVEFSWDGMNYFEANGKENWTYNWAVPSSGNYNLYSRAKDLKGNLEDPPNSINVNVIIDTFPPENVGNSLICNKISSNIIYLNWEDKSSSGAVYYNIYKGFTPNFMYSNPTPYSTSNSNNFTDAQAIEEKIFYVVKAVDICGNESED